MKTQRGNESIRTNDSQENQRLTVVNFVEKKFMPEHVAFKTSFGRLHYRSMLKHVLTPEEVTRIFDAGVVKLKGKREPIAGWPYLSNIELCDVQPHHVQQLVSAAFERGYSIQTVQHIRYAVNAIFSHARREGCYGRVNPANRVKLPGMVRKEACRLTLIQAAELLKSMQYPEREMTLLLLLTNMSVVEVCGLQWKCVNLTGSWSTVDRDSIPPFTITIRKQWHHGAAEDVRTSRVRKILIPEMLLRALIRQRDRGSFAEPKDYVLVSRNGTPINEANIANRRLHPLGKKLQIASLNWSLIRRLRADLLKQFGEHLQYHMAIALESSSCADVAHRLQTTDASGRS